MSPQVAAIRVNTAFQYQILFDWPSMILAGDPQPSLGKDPVGIPALWTPLNVTE